jgi:hypothetical protein
MKLARVLAATAAVAAFASSASAAVLNFDDLTKPGVGRENIAPTDFRYAGFVFHSTYSLNPNFFTLRADDPANADPDGTTFSHTWDGYETYMYRQDGGLFDLRSIDIADKFNTGGRHSGRFRFIYENNRQESVDFLTDAKTGLQTILFNKTDLKGFLWYGDVGEGIQVDNLVLEGPQTAVPEPATWALLLAGFFGLGGALRAQRRQGQLA